MSTVVGSACHEPPVQNQPGLQLSEGSANPSAETKIKVLEFIVKINKYKISFRFHSMGIKICHSQCIINNLLSQYSPGGQLKQSESLFEPLTGLYVPFTHGYSKACLVPGGQ